MWQIYCGAEDFCTDCEVDCKMNNKMRALSRDGRYELQCGMVKDTGVAGWERINGRRKQNAKRWGKLRESWNMRGKCVEGGGRR